ncbi:MAG: glycosyltransferase family 4 protein [Lachnospiraceae bacterium]|nr:glycosyltransferase family 4 protein [Lachnospiraceae bacterium]
MQAFLNKGYKVIALGQEQESEWSEKFAENGIEYRQIYVERNGVNPAHDLRTIKELDSFLKKEKPEKIFCYQAKTIIYTCLAAKKNGISEVYPLVAGLGSIFNGTSFKGKLLKTVMCTEYKVALRNSKAVMFQNNDDLSAFVNEGIVKKEKCRIINGSGVDVEKFTVRLMPEEPAFLMITRLIRDKGVGEYLDACRLIKKNNPAIRCLLVGPYDTNPSAITPAILQDYIDDGSVEYFGEQEDVRPFIEQASVFVLPSYHEGTPKTVLESMACGRAIITTDAPGCRETVTDGVNGFLVPVKDAGAVADKMQQFIEKPELAIEMGSKGRRLVEEKYDVNKVNESIMKIMNI